MLGHHMLVASSLGQKQPHCQTRSSTPLLFAASSCPPPSHARSRPPARPSSLCQNNIHTLPDSIQQCTALRLLSIGSNDLRDFPPDFFTSLTRLERLYCYKNKLQGLPEDVAAMQNLQVGRVSASAVSVSACASA